MLQQQENRPLQYYLSQRSQPLDPDNDSFLLNDCHENLENKSNNKLQENFLPSFPSNLEEYVKDSQQNSLKTSSRNTGRILLPNPYPKKNSQRNSFANDESGSQKILENSEENNSGNQPKSRKNSFTIEEFKEYNKKFQGKKLSERLDMISQEYENKVIGDLKKIEEKITETKPHNLIFLKNSISPKIKNTDFSLNEAVSKNMDELKINNTNETLNERYVSMEKKEEKTSLIMNKKTFSSNSKYDQTNELEYSPFTNKPSQENSRSYLLGTQSHSNKKQLIKIEEFSDFNSSYTKPNIQKINEKIKNDIELFQKKNTKKKDFLIQTNISPSNQDLMMQFRNLNVSPIDNGSALKENSNKKIGYSSGKKEEKDEICQANFESFDQYFVSKYDLKRENKNEEEENFQSIGDPLSDPKKFISFNEKKEDLEEKQRDGKQGKLENL